MKYGLYFVALLAAGCAGGAQKSDTPISTTTATTTSPASSQVAATADAAAVTSNDAGDDAGAATDDAGESYGAGSIDTGFVYGGDAGEPPLTIVPGPYIDPITKLQRIIIAHLGAVHACYDVAAAKDPSLKGTVTVAWRINRDGSVPYAHVVSATFRAPRELTECILRQVVKWRFEDGDGDDVSYGFKLGVDDS
jgi:hypothetical protein